MNIIGILKLFVTNDDHELKFVKSFLSHYYDSDFHSHVKLLKTSQFFNNNN